MTSTSDGATGPVPGASAELARRFAPELVSAGVERAVTVDQTNRSVVVDESIIVKWFVPCVPLPHPGVRVLKHLAAVGFTDMPEFFAAEVVDGQVRASVSEYVVGALDGWDWFVEELTEAAALPEAATLHSSAHALGSLAGRLHIALATPSAVISDPVVTVDPAEELRRCRSLLDEAAAVVEGDAAAVLHPRISQIGETFASAATVQSDATPAMPLHGDLHVGQVLRSGERLVITDFDGNPLLDHGEQHLARPAAIDVASLVQSIDHAGRVAQRRRPELADELETLIGAARAAALASYRSTLADAGRSSLFDDRLLTAFQVAQELHELVYAARHLPRWAYAPTAALRAMFPDGTAARDGHHDHGTGHGREGVEDGAPSIQS
jgi:maltokinase